MGIQLVQQPKPEQLTPAVIEAARRVFGIETRNRAYTVKYLSGPKEGYRKMNLPEGTPLTFDTIYHGKRKGLIAVFKVGGFGEADGIASNPVSEHDFLVEVPVAEFYEMLLGVGALVAILENAASSEVLYEDLDDAVAEELASSDFGKYV